MSIISAVLKLALRVEILLKDDRVLISSSSRMRILGAAGGILDRRCILTLLKALVGLVGDHELLDARIVLSTLRRGQEVLLGLVLGIFGRRQSRHSLVGAFGMSDLLLLHRMLLFAFVWPALEVDRQALLLDIARPAIW